MYSHMWIHGHEISGFPAGFYQNPEDFWEGSVELRTDSNGMATYNYVDHIQYKNSRISLGNSGMPNPGSGPSYSIRSIMTWAPMLPRGIK